MFNKKHSELIKWKDFGILAVENLTPSRKR